MRDCLHRSDFECIVTALEVTETQFNSMLAPVRATVAVTLAVVEEPGNASFEADSAHRGRLIARTGNVTRVG